jgi:uncharacterized membrane protein
MRRPAIAYGATLLVFLALDSVWLGLTASRLYRPLIGPLLAPAPVLWAAALFYLLYAAGLTAFVVMPGTAHGRALGTLGRGAFFGLVAYATYDLTNQATMRNWPLLLSVADLAWGMVVSGVAATAGRAVLGDMQRRHA